MAPALSDTRCYRSCVPLKSLYALLGTTEVVRSLEWHNPANPPKKTAHSARRKWHPKPRLFVLEEDRSNLGIKVSNPDLNTFTNYTLHLMDISVNNITIPMVDFDTEISLYSNQFQRIIKEMNGLAKCVEIKAVKNQIIFHCKGLFSERETVIMENEKGLKINKPLADNKIVQCIYLLKILTTFTKCTSLSPIVELKLKNDFALVIRYPVGNLGTIELILSNYMDEE